jgi:hypothetical protein
MVHSDGDVSDLVPDLIEIGVQILNPVQPEAMNVLEIKRIYGREICLNGGISTQLTLPLGTPQEVEREVISCLRILGERGGYVAGPAKAIMGDVPLANAVALIDTLLCQPVSIAQKGNTETLRRVYAAYHPGVPSRESGAQEILL